MAETDGNRVGKNIAYWLVSLLLIGALPVFAQAPHSPEDCKFHVHGMVYDTEKREPIPGAEIYVMELAKGSVTDVTGDYTIEDLCAGEYTIVCTYVGYAPDTVKIQLSPQQNFQEQNFRLQETDLQLKTVTITERRLEPPTVQPKVELAGEELERTRGQSLGESLKGITGVNSIQTGPSISKPVIHGLHSNRILILNNGVRQEGQQWGSEHAPEIDPFVASRISVIKGAAGVRYGPDAIGGVILVEPNPLPYKPGISGEANLVGWSNSGMGVASGILQGGIAKSDAWSWRVQGTAKRAGNVRTPNYYLDNTGIQELNFSGALGYRKKNYGAELFFSRFDTEIGIFGGAHIGNVTDLLTAINSEQPLIQSGFSYKIGRPYQDVNHSLFKASAFFKPENVGKFTLTYAQQYNYRGEYDSHRPRNDSLAALNLPELEFTLNTQTADLIWEHPSITKTITGSIGVSTIYQANIIGGIRSVVPNFRNQGIGVFAIERWVKNRLELEAGIRYDFRYLEVFRRKKGALLTPKYNFGNLSGSIGGIYRLTDNVSVQANFGTAWRPPNVSELFSDGVHHGAAAYERGDSTMNAEVAYNTMVSATYTHAKFNVEVGLYNNYINNYIYLMPGEAPILTIRGAFPFFQYKQVDAVFQGVDASAKVQFHPALSWTGKLSLVRAKNTTTNEYLVYIPADRLENTLRYQLPKVGKMNLPYLSFTGINVSKQRRVEPNTDYAPPPTGYVLLNAEAGFTLPALHNVEIGITVHNLLNTTYRDYLNRFRYYTDEMGRSFNVRLKMQF